MKRFLRLVLILGCATTPPLSAQLRQAQGKSPREVVLQYVKMIEDGTLLTPDGWEKACDLFDGPCSLAPEKVTVTSRHNSVTERWVKEGRAEVEDFGWDELGTVDSKLLYVPAPKSGYEGNIGGIYHLILSNKHWEGSASGRPLKQVTGTWEWRFEGSQAVRWSSLEATIRYVTEERERTTDALVKRNADRTLALLKHLPH